VATVSNVIRCRRRVGPLPLGWSAALLAATSVGVALASGSSVVRASQGYSGYEGAFSSTAPNGYAAAPSQTSPGATVSYRFTVTNNSLFAGTPGGRVFTQRITRVNGSDVSSGAPAFTEDQVLAATTSGDTPSSFALDSHQIPGILGSNTFDYAETVHVGGCGYWAIWVEDPTSGTQPDVHNSNQDLLNAGVVRVDGCATPSPPTSTPRPPATAAPSTAPTSSPPRPSSAPTSAGSAAAPPPARTPGLPSSSPGPSLSQPSPSPGADRAVARAEPTPQAGTGGSLPGTQPTEPASPADTNTFGTGRGRAGTSVALMLVGASVVLVGLAVSGAVAIVSRRKGSRGGAEDGGSPAPSGGGLPGAGGALGGAFRSTGAPARRR
jgi:hypothetical protein